MNENFLNRKLEEKKKQFAFRKLSVDAGLADFYSNDYLGIVKNRLIEKELNGSSYAHGSTGSRLLAGNSQLAEETEKEIATFHESESALLFNSGFDANFGLLSAVAGKGDTIIYDKLSHASLRDGVRQSFADAFSFAHNDMADLEKKLAGRKGNCFVVTESVFSMDGDLAPLAAVADLCLRYDSLLIVDEAHATGCIGDRGEGLVQLLGLQTSCFARIHTFGKALGAHGAVILGSATLRDFLINFCRPLIYSTALPPIAIAAIRSSYNIFPGLKTERTYLQKLIGLFHRPEFKQSPTTIQCFIRPGNEQIKNKAQMLKENGLDARPILSPTVPQGAERLRIALHSYNSLEETTRLISLLTTSS